MSYLDSFAEFLENEGVATRGQDLFIGSAPRQTTDDVQEGQWWIIPAGGNQDGTDFNRWQRNLFVDVFYRDRDPKCVIDKFENLRNVIANNPCVNLTGYDTVLMEVSAELLDTDVDTEDNKIGVMGIRLVVTQQT